MVINDVSESDEFTESMILIFFSDIPRKFGIVVPKVAHKEICQVEFHVAGVLAVEVLYSPSARRVESQWFLRYAEVQSGMDLKEAHKFLSYIPHSSSRGTGQVHCLHATWATACHRLMKQSFVVMLNLISCSYP